jgi:hypothetical protein
MLLSESLPLCTLLVAQLTRRYEHTHKWSYPKMLYFSVLMCAIGAATQGWDQTGSNGASKSSQ